MSLSTTMLQSDLAAMVADLPSVMTWGSQTVSGTATAVRDTDTPRMAGFLDEDDLEWTAPVGSFTSSIAPQIRAKVAIAGVNYSVTERLLSPDGVAIMLKLRKLR